MLTHTHGDSLSTNAGLGALVFLLGDFLVLAFDVYGIQSDKFKGMRAAFGASGGIGLFMRFLKTCPEDEGTRMDRWYDKVFMCVGGLFVAATKVKAHQDLCAQDGGIETLMNLMATHKNNSGVIFCLCQLLDALCEDHQENSDKVVSLGGIKRIFRASKLQNSDEKLMALVRNVFEGFATRNQHTAGHFQELEERDQAKRAEACVACGRSAEVLGLRRMLKCSACTIAPLYCCVQCQKACWGTHKAECKANRRVLQ